MRLYLWGYIYAFLISLIMVTEISGITISVTSGIATTIVGPVATVVQTATVIAIPGLSSTVTNVGSPAAVTSSIFVTDGPSFFNTVPTTTLVSTGTHFLTDSLTQITVTTSTSSTVPGLSSSILGISISSSSTSSSGTSVLSSFQTSSKPTSTPAPVADDVPTDTLKPDAKDNPGAVAGGVVGGFAAIGVLVGLILYFCRDRSKKTKRGKKLKGKKSINGLAPDGNNPKNTRSAAMQSFKNLNNLPGSRSPQNARNSPSSDVEKGIPLRNIAAPTTATKSITEISSEYYPKPPAAAATRPGAPRPTSPLSTVGTVSTFAPTFLGNNHDETMWPINPAMAAAFAARNKEIAAAGPQTPPNRPPRPDDDPLEVLKKKMARKTPPPTHLPHIRFERSPAGTPPRQIRHQGGPGSQNAQGGIPRPDGAHYQGINSLNIHYGVMNPYEDDAGERPAPIDDTNDITQLSIRPSERALSPEPLNIVKRSPSQPGNAPQTPTRPPGNRKILPIPVEMKVDSDESDEQTKEENRKAALKSLEGNSPHLTTDMALRKDFISVHTPPRPVKGKGFGIMHRSSAGNLSLLKAETALGSPASGRKTSSIYSRNSDGIPPPDIPDSAVFEDYKHDHERKGKANSTELNLNDGFFYDHIYNKRNV